MQIKTAQFLMSNTDMHKCPAPNLPEYAFIGRSNVGKSSLINMLCERKSLAKISTKPGKTQLINHFNINESWYLVDLPGYGYAKVSKDKKANWEKFIVEYITLRKNLLCLFVLIDSRLPMQKIDLEFMNWLGEEQIAFVIVFTKIDKLGKKQFIDNTESYKNQMKKEWDELPTMYYTSAEKKQGRTELLDFISDTNKLFVKPNP